MADGLPAVTPSPSSSTTSAQPAQASARSSGESACDCQPESNRHCHAKLVLAATNVIDPAVKLPRNMCSVHPFAYGVWFMSRALVATFNVRMARHRHQRLVPDWQMVPFSDGREAM